MVNESEYADIKRRMENLAQSRQELRAKRDRYQGHVEAAQKALREAESACREKGIDPNQIDEVLQKLTERYRTQLDALEQAISQIHNELSSMESEA